jgi:hypothetical protein
MWFSLRKSLYRQSEAAPERGRLSFCLFYVPFFGGLLGTDEDILGGNIVLPFQGGKGVGYAIEKGCIIFGKFPGIDFQHVISPR